MKFRQVVFLTILAVAMTSLAAGQPVCGPHSLRGTWGLMEFGWSLPNGVPNAQPMPYTGIGVFTIDDNGKMTGSGTVVSSASIPGTPIPAGTVLDFTFEGKAEITPDCTGSWKFTISMGGVPIPGDFAERFIYYPQQDEFQVMSIKSPLSKPLWVGIVRRLSKVVAPVLWPAPIS